MKTSHRHQWGFYGLGNNLYMLLLLCSFELIPERPGWTGLERPAQAELEIRKCLDLESEPHSEIILEQVTAIYIIYKFDFPTVKVPDHFQLLLLNGPLLIIEVKPLIQTYCPLWIDFIFKIVGKLISRVLGKLFITISQIKS